MMGYNQYNIYIYQYNHLTLLGFNIDMFVNVNYLNDLSGICCAQGEEKITCSELTASWRCRQKIGASTDGSTLEDGSKCKIADFEDIVLIYLYMYVTVCVYKLHTVDDFFLRILLV